MWNRKQRRKVSKELEKIKQDPAFREWLAEYVIYKAADQDVLALWQGFQMHLTAEQMTNLADLAAKAEKGAKEDAGN